jgi:hypothetical protein
MAAITTKFSVNDVCYTFDNKSGIIYRGIVHQITVTSKALGDTEVVYMLANITPDQSGNTLRSASNMEYEQNLYTQAEVTELANVWLMNKSVNIFSNAGL